MRAPQRSRRVFREDVVAGLDSFVTGKARVHYLFVGERLEVFTKIRVTPTARRGVLLAVLLHKLQVPIGCVSGNERLCLTKYFVVLFLWDHLPSASADDSALGEGLTCAISLDRFVV